MRVYLHIGNLHFPGVEHERQEKVIGILQSPRLGLSDSTARQGDIAPTLLWRGGLKSDSDVNQSEI